MTKYIVYAIDEDRPVVNGASYKPVKKFKREPDAMNFIDDVKNLSKYGCMIVIKDTDSDGSYSWNSEINAWEKMEA